MRKRFNRALFWYNDDGNKADGGDEWVSEWLRVRSHELKHGTTVVGNCFSAPPFFDKRNLCLPSESAPTVNHNRSIRSRLWLRRWRRSTNQRTALLREHVQNTTQQPFHARRRSMLLGQHKIYLSDQRSLLLLLLLLFITTLKRQHLTNSNRK